MKSIISIFLIMISSQAFALKFNDPHDPGVCKASINGKFLDMPYNIRFGLFDVRDQNIGLSVALLEPYVRVIVGGLDNIPSSQITTMTSPDFQGHLNFSLKKLETEVIINCQ